MSDLMSSFGLADNSLAHLTSSVQFGFIIGTLCFAVVSIADRFSPSTVFFVCAMLGSLVNLGVLWEGNHLASILVYRFLTGFFLAGIYPVGMKIAADHFEKGLGKSLGFLVGALVLGTAFPHLLKDLTQIFPWKAVILVVSALAALGGLLMLLIVPDGPFRTASRSFNSSAFFSVFRNRAFRSAAVGYFGHMWELYAFWAFVPLILQLYVLDHPGTSLNIPLLSFFIIGIGGLACVFGGYLSQVAGVKRTASWALVLSGICCLLSPLMFSINMEGLFISFLIVWGMVVVADSPLFSTLIAQHAPAEHTGTALTIVNSIGFAVSIISIQLIQIIHSFTDSKAMYMILAVGPILGLMGLTKFKIIGRG